jgi:hypothetical protein
VGAPLFCVVGRFMRSLGVMSFHGERGIRFHFTVVKSVDVDRFRMRKPLLMRPILCERPILVVVDSYQ